MLATVITDNGLKVPNCNCGSPAEIVMQGYAANADNNLCVSCALQLARKLTEDLCELTAGGRHA